MRWVGGEEPGSIMYASDSVLVSQHRKRERERERERRERKRVRERGGGGAFFVKLSY